MKPEYKLSGWNNDPGWWRNFKTDFLKNTPAMGYDVERAIREELKLNNVTAESRGPDGLWLVFDSESDAIMFILRWS